jgi:hypothetical protein
MMHPTPQPKIKHVGRNRHRLASNPKEKVFARAWLEQQTESHTLQWLLCASPDQNTQERDLTQLEATCAATLMQWLGSPVGFCFLQDALRECGYELRKK